MKSHPMLRSGLQCLAIAAALASLTAPAWATTPGTPLTPEIVVAPASTIGVGGNARIASSQSGSFVVVWSDSERSSPVPLHAQVFNADGSPKTGNILVAAAPTAFFYEASQPVSMNARGEFAVGYLARPDDTFIQHVFVQRYAADGTPNGAPLDVAQEPRFSLGLFEIGGNIGSPAVAIDDSGAVVAGWTLGQFSGIASTIPTGRSNYVYTRRYRADGTAEGAAQIASFREFGFFGAQLRIVMSSTGSYAVGYLTDPFITKNDGQNVAQNFAIRFQLYSADGRRTGLSTRFLQTGRAKDNPLGADYALSFAGNSDLVLAWSAPDLTDSARERVLFRRFSTLGVPRGSLVEVATRQAEFPYPSQQDSISLSPLASGGVAVTWPDASPSTHTGTGYGRYYAANDAPLGNAFPIAGNIREIESTINTQGNLVTTYGDVFARIFQGP